MDVELLYTIYEKLTNAKDKISQFENEYKEAILGAKGGAKEKQLATQIIAKFFKHFPSSQDDAMNALIDICECEDSVRIVAIKVFPNICKDVSEYLVKIAGVLVQLLQVEDPQEYNLVNSTLNQLLNDDPAKVLKCIFEIFKYRETEDALREKCIKFILTKVNTLSREVLTPEIENYMFTEITKCLSICSPTDFVSLFSYLISSKFSQNLENQQTLINIVAEQIDIDEEQFVPFEEDNNNVDRLVTCVKHIVPLFSNKLESTKFITFYCEQVLPCWDVIEKLADGNKYQLLIAQQLAELAHHCGTLENPNQYITRLFDVLKLYMPPPPEEPSDTVPVFKFSIVEALLYAFHRIARQSPEFLTEDPARLKDFRSRLLYFSRGLQGCLKALNMSSKEKIFTPEEKKLREHSPKVLNNINTIIKDLFYQPPIYKAVVTLSYKVQDKIISSPKKPAETATTAVTARTKRHIPITYDNDGNQNNKVTRQGDKKIYTPPSGKYSNNFQSDRNGRYQSGRRGGIRGGRNRGRGGFRK